jgi:hypothetical protein
MIRSAAVALVALAVSASACASSSEERNARSVETVRGDMPKYRALLERVRGASFGGTDVTVAGQTEEAFRARIREEVDRDLPEAKARAVERSLARLGLIPEGYGLRDQTVDTIAGQAFAYYDPRAKTFYLLRPDAPEKQLVPAIIHELDHALEDARFDLEKLRARVAAELDDDRENALMFLVEGEATYVMTVAALAQEGIPAELADMIVQSEAALTRDQLLEKQEAQSQGKPPDPALEQARRMPLYVYRTLLEPYTRGSALVSYVKRHGGWGAVDALYRSPPASTEQCLHPEKLVAGERPVRLELPDLDPGVGDVLSENTLGELGIDCFVRERLGPGHESAAPGWAGDRYRAYDRGGRTAIVWVTTWDTDEDAREFEAAAVEMAKLDAARLVAGETSRALRRERDVFVLLGVPETEAGKVLEKLATGVKRSR